MTGALAAASLVSTGLCVGCLAYLHLEASGYSPLADAVSAYGTGEYAAWYRAQTTCAGIAAALLAGALRHPGHVLALLVVFALARLAITIAPMDTHLVAHWLLAVAAFGSIAAAGIRLKPAQHGLPPLGWAMLACLAATVVARRSPPLRCWFGLAERGFYVAMLAWLALVAVRLV